MPEIEPRDRTLKALEGLHLWHASRSSCSQRVRIVLAETKRDFISHLVDLEKNEHATEAYQAIHPKGLVPALVEDGHLFIESIDIIKRIAGTTSELAMESSPELLSMADEAQQHLKLLTFEFLFRANPPPKEQVAEAFQKLHKNNSLKQFRIDFANGFESERIKNSVRATEMSFQHLDQILTDGRQFLSGDKFSLSDVSWIPNVHRFSLMDWPFENTPHLNKWFKRVAMRLSYKKALLDWQNEGVAELFANYTATRRAVGTDVRSVLMS